MHFLRRVSRAIGGFRSEFHAAEMDIGCCCKVIVKACRESCIEAMSSFEEAEVHCFRKSSACSGNAGGGAILYRTTIYLLICSICFINLYYNQLYHNVLSGGIRPQYTLLCTVRRVPVRMVVMSATFGALGEKAGTLSPSRHHIIICYSIITCMYIYMYVSVHIYIYMHMMA